MLYFCFLLGRKPADLQNLAPGTHPPFITFNGEVKTDVNKIEEFLEDVLCPPKLVNECVCGFKCRVSTPHKKVLFDLCVCLYAQVL